MSLRIIDTSHVDAFWPLVADDLQAACLRCNAENLNSGALWQMCRSGQASLFLWVVDGEILVKSVWRFDTPNYPHSFRCMMLSGKNMDQWVSEYSDTITQFAKNYGATQLVTTGRKGWLKLFPKAEKIGANYEVDI